MNASTLAKTAADLEEHTEILRDPTYYSRGPGPDVMDAASLTGDHVVNAAGEHLGRIEAIMLDVRSGRIAYAVLSFGGFLGIHDKLFAIPWSALTLDAVHKRFVLDVDFSRTDVSVNELDINYMRASVPARLTIELFSAGGELRQTSSFELAGRTPGSRFETFPMPIQAGQFRFTITPVQGETTNVTIVDLRLQGQTARLADYIRRSLPFPRR